GALEAADRKVHLEGVALLVGRRHARQPPERLLHRDGAGVTEPRTRNYLDRSRNARRRQRSARQPARRDLDGGERNHRRLLLGGGRAHDQEHGHEGRETHWVESHRRDRHAPFRTDSWGIARPAGRWQGPSGYQPGGQVATDRGPGGDEPPDSSGAGRGATDRGPGGNEPQDSSAACGGTRRGRRGRPRRGVETLASVTAGVLNFN